MKANDINADAMKADAMNRAPAGRNALTRTEGLLITEVPPAEISPSELRMAARDASEQLVRLVDVSAGYGDKVVLSGVSLDILDGDFLGITGPNGGGKSTLVKVVAGLVAPRSGRVEYSDRLCACAARRNGGGGGPHRRGVRHIGYLPQQSHFDRSFPISVIDTVLSGLQVEKTFSGRYTRIDFERARNILKDNGIAELERRHIGELSGGQLQRVMLCRALVSGPRLLMLDEPTTWVDSRFSEDLQGLLRGLNDGGMTIVMVSHDEAAIASMTRRVVRIDGTVLPQTR